jgi:K+-sensing histidine kinase KdpD
LLSLGHIVPACDEDDGPGISDARKDVVLEPFVRGDDARNIDETAGFGLGLSIVRSIVLAHGGELSLNDRQLHGLIVRIQLPVRQQSRRAAAGARKTLSFGHQTARMRGARSA